MLSERMWRGRAIVGVVAAVVSAAVSVVGPAKVAAEVNGVITPRHPVNAGTVGRFVNVEFVVTGSDGAPKSGVRLDFSRSGAHGPATSSSVTNSVGKAGYIYWGTLVGTDTVTAQVANWTGAVSMATVTWQTQPAYASNECTGPAVFDGFVRNEQVKFRTHPRDAGLDVCLAVDDGSQHVGGKLSIAASGPTNVVTDGAHDMCDSNPATRILDEEGFVGPVRFDIDINVSPGDGDAAWICMQVIDGLNNVQVVGERFVVKGPLSWTTSFVPDPAVPNTAPVPSRSSGSASGTCTNNVLSGETGGARVWVASDGSDAFCVRVEGDGVAEGGRLTVDDNGNQGMLKLQNVVAPGTAFGVCTIPVVGLSTPRVHVTAHVGSPSYVCLGVLSTSMLVTVDGQGGQTFARFIRDE